MRLLLLPRYGPLGASSRLRMYQYLPALEAAGFEVTVAPLFSDHYVESLYATGRRPWSDILVGYLKRLRALLQAGKVDVVWVEKELLPYLPAVCEHALSKAHVPYVVDYDDAVFHTYDQHRLPWVRALLGERLTPLISGAYAVTAGNAYLADYAQRHGAGRVEIVPTVVDLRRYDVLPEPDDSIFRIGWIGSASTVKYLDQLREPLRQLARHGDVCLVTIGAPALKGLGVALEQHPWSADTEAALLATIHVGVMPLPDTPWERGKCGYKLIQYMACGRPVVASPVGINSEIVDDSVGFLAEDHDAWIAALSRLRTQPELRRSQGAAGRKKIESLYSLQAVAPGISRLLEEAAGMPGCGRAGPQPRGARRQNAH